MLAARDNGIGDAGLLALAPALRRRPTLEGLSAGALPAVTTLFLYNNMLVGDAGASALAAALNRGALPRLKGLCLANAAITDAGLVALAPALRRRPALEFLSFSGNPLGDEGLAALVAPPPQAGALSPPTGVLTNLNELILEKTQLSDAGCSALTAALTSGVLPALENLILDDIPASDAAWAAVREALDKLKDSMPDSESEEDEEEEGEEEEGEGN